MTSQHERTALHVELMKQAALQALSYVQGMTQQSFDLDHKTQDAVVMKLLVIGELATKVMAEDPPFVERHTFIPWVQMKGMRNRMAHGYFELDQAVVWDTVTNALPDLITQLDQIK
ncbi:MAG: hypothetical protein RL651_638 [Pseudomonadota bacterium]|jgi:uncharacterized protein with HEPN domain